MIEQDTPRIFLCHASEDKPQVKKLYRQLKAAGYHPWLDQYDLIPGQDWRREIRKLITHPFKLDMILIPAGKFLMGSDLKKDNRVRDNEQPQHSVYLPDYYIAKTPVTNAQYAAFVQATNHQKPEYWTNDNIPNGKEDHPAVNVSWRDAVAFCRWLADETGQPYRLPTEAEWEKAARGSDGRIYPWGDEWDATRCNTREGGLGDTTPVGAYPNGASPYGVLDMAGNVWEWCATKWEKAYPYDAEEDEWTAEYLEGTNVWVLRGGSWRDDIVYDARCAFRGRGDDVYRYDFVGFRLGFSSK